MMMRLVRVLLVALALVALISYSQDVTEATEGQRVPGVGWALAVLSLVFFVRAAVTEHARGSDANLEKDILWGLSLGTLAGVASLAFL